MTFGREKRLLLGLLAFVAPLPLPFNEPRPEGVVGLPYLFAYLSLVGLFLYRSASGRESWLRPWMLNGLGLLYLPFFFVDFATNWRIHLVRPMMHLVMFALVVKLFSLRRERDKWQVTIGIFFLFLASMATSASPGIVLYLALFFGLGFVTLVRFAQLHVRGAYGVDREPRSSALGYFIGASVAGAVALAVPLFLVLPRVKTPYVVGGGFSGMQVGYSTGFSDEVSLDVIGNIRGSREVALRAQLASGERQALHELRFRGATYDRYEGLHWQRAGILRQIRPLRNRYRLAEGEVVERMRIWLQPLRATSLILPVQSLEVDLTARHLNRGRGGTLALPAIPSDTLEYEVGLGRSPVYLAVPPAEADPTLSQRGVTPRISALAAEVAGTGSVAEKARRLESHLISSYEYTLDFVGRRAEAPIEDFLFEYKSGHCEYFASAMVLLLRSQGIPARLVTGFLGGEFNPLEGYYIVRQSNAHAWVEAYLPGHGWQAYDPTPPSGRPADQGPSLRLLLRQAYDYVVFRWDRYILSYGFEDQLTAFRRLREYLGRLLAALRSSGDEVASREAADRAAVVEESRPATDEGSRLAGPLSWSVLVLVAGTLLLWWWRRRPLSATVAYQRLRRRLARKGMKIEPSLPPGVVEHRVVRRFPTVGPTTSRLIDLYLRESFGEERLSEAERREVETLLRSATRDLRRAS